MTEVEINDEARRIVHLVGDADLFFQETSRTKQVVLRRLKYILDRVSLKYLLQRRIDLVEALYPFIGFVELCIEMPGEFAGKHDVPASN